MTELYTLELVDEEDVFSARQAGREVAAALGMPAQDVVRVATAVSEIGRDVIAAGGARATFTLVVPDRLVIEVRTFGPDPFLESDHGALGVAAARRLMDSTAMDTDPEGRAIVLLGKKVGRLTIVGGPEREALRQRVASRVHSPLEELRTQNRELVVALEDEQARRDELAVVNDELEHTKGRLQTLYDELSGELETTNKGVVALYAEIDDKSRQLKEANESKTAFLRNVSHELRTPGNSILGLARLLLDTQAAPLTLEQREQVEFVQASALDLVRLVNELLDLAKAESGRLTVTVQAIDLSALFKQLRGTTAPLVVRPEVELVVEDPADVGTVHTDATLLAHVLRNLLSNAVKFTEVGKVRMRAERYADRLRITVSDTGIGIAPEDQRRVFEEFFQVRTPLHAATTGTGLGLPYARRIALTLGGDLTVTSLPGAGTTFTLELPVLTTGDGASQEPR